MTHAALALVLSAVLIAACAGTGPGPTAEPATEVSATDAPAIEPPPAQSPAFAPGEPGGAIGIVGVEYAYEHAPREARTGSAFSFRNAGREAHELVLLRRNDGVTLSWEEILALPEEQLLAAIAYKGQLLADPGRAAHGTVIADEPGDYLLVCFIPVGLRQLPDPEDLEPELPAGPPHFSRGMHAEVAVGQG